MAMLHADVPGSSGSQGLRQAQLDDLRVALAALPNAGLHAMRTMALEANHIAPCLMLWIEHAARWEIDRRARHTYVLHDPLDVIYSGEISPSILMLAALSTRFGAEHGEAQAFFSAIIARLNVQRVVH